MRQQTRQSHERTKKNVCRHDGIILVARPEQAIPGAKGCAGAVAAGHTPLEIMQEATALRLITWLPYENHDKVAILAGILATVRQNTSKSLGRSIGHAAADSDRKPLLSEHNLQRLLQTEAPDLLPAMRRLVRQTHGTINVYDMAFVVLRWGTGIKKRLLLDYYGGPAPPPATGADEGVPDSTH